MEQVKPTQERSKSSLRIKFINLLPRHFQPIQFLFNQCSYIQLHLEIIRVILQIIRNPQNAQEDKTGASINVSATKVRRLHEQFKCDASQHQPANTSKARL